MLNTTMHPPSLFDHRGPSPKGTNPVEASRNQSVYVRVRKSLLQPILTTLPTTTPPTMNPSTMSPPSGHLYLIEGTLQDIERFAGSTAEWVIKVAHHICSPRQTGRVYTHTTGTPYDWYYRDRGDDWREVTPGDQLLPGIYEFDTSFPIVLSRLSDREAHSRTSIGSKSSSATFHQALLLRDGVCVVTRSPDAIRASHLVPKRMGTEGAKAVAREFVGTQAALEVHRFHPMIGILLFASLDERVDRYTLGFYHNTGDTYTLHNFDTVTPNISVIGARFPFLSNVGVPRLHGFQITLSVQGGDVPLPPKGIFDWHYMQCVAKIFATSDYKAVPNVYFYVYPFKTDDNSSDDEVEFEDNDDVEPPYPTYRFDRFLAEQGRRQMMHDHAKEVALWSAGIISSTTTDDPP